MLDLLAAIVSADPPSLLAWAVLAFAAGMYPIGIMLGSTCSPCCASPCSGPCAKNEDCPPGCQCVGGQCGGSLPCVDCKGDSLPDTVTVSVTNWPADRVQGGSLAFLNFESDFGFGAAGKVTAPGDNPGPVSAVELTSGGEGYARIIVERLEPTVTASAGGTQQFTVSLEKVGEGEEAVWEVSGLALNGEGTTTSNNITFTVEAPGVEVEPASAFLVRGRTAPSLSMSVASAAGGGAQLVPVMLQGFSNCDGSPVWALNDFAINNAGSGYAVGDELVFTPTNGVEHCGDFVTPWVVKTVGPGGSIVDFELDTDDKDIIDGWFREYYAEGGPIEFIQVTSAGAYYLPGPTTVEVATVTVTVAQRGRAEGTYGGAAISATINTNPNSATFGQIAALNIANGGFGYLAWEWVEICCGPYWNGKSVVLRRPSRTQGGFGNLNPCLYRHTRTNKGCSATIELEYSPQSVRVMVNDPAGFTPRGNDVSPAFVSAGCFEEIWKTPGPGEDCVGLPFSATSPRGITLTVAPGGNYTPEIATPTNVRHVCCPDGSFAPLELEVRVHEPSAPYLPEPDPPFTTYVLPRGGGGPSGATADCTISYGGFGLYVAVMRCDSYYGANCQSCARNCETRVGMPGDDYVNFPSNHTFSRPCNACSSPTMCKPVSGMYVINRRDPRFNDGEGLPMEWFQWTEPPPEGFTPGDDNFYKIEIPE